MTRILSALVLLLAPLPSLAQSLPACARGGGDCDCADLTRAQAQRLLARDRSDPHRLDRDGDGLACEVSGRQRPAVRRSATPAPRRLAPVRVRPSTRATPRRSSARRAPARSLGRPSSGYHTGSRGGCYTYTASGRKRYVDRSYCR